MSVIVEQYLENITVSVEDASENITVKVSLLNENETIYTLTTQKIKDAGGVTGISLNGGEVQTPAEGVVDFLVENGTAVERTIKPISNTSQYTLVAADFTDFILDFTANGGQNIAVILNAGVAPLSGQIQAISSGNNTLTPTVGSGTGSSTYSITIDSPTEGQEFTEGDTITTTGTVTETAGSGTVVFIHPEGTNLVTTPKGWFGGVVLSADAVSINGNLESTEGFVLTAPNGTRYNLTVNNEGSLITTAL